MTETMRYPERRESLADIEAFVAEAKRRIEVMGGAYLIRAVLGRVELGESAFRMIEAYQRLTALHVAASDPKLTPAEVADHRKTAANLLKTFWSGGPTTERDAEGWAAYAEWSQNMEADHWCGIDPKDIPRIVDTLRAAWGLPKVEDTPYYNALNELWVEVERQDLRIETAFVAIEDIPKLYQQRNAGFDVTTHFVLWCRGIVGHYRGATVYATSHVLPGHVVLLPGDVVGYPISSAGNVKLNIKEKTMDLQLPPPSAIYPLYGNGS